MLLVPWTTFFHALESKLHASLSPDEAAFKAHLGKQKIALCLYCAPQLTKDLATCDATPCRRLRRASAAVVACDRSKKTSRWTAS